MSGMQFTPTLYTALQALCRVLCTSLNLVGHVSQPFLWVSSTKRLGFRGSTVLSKSPRGLVAVLKHHDFLCLRSLYMIAANTKRNNGRKVHVSKV